MCEAPNQDMESLEVKIEYSEKQRSRLWGKQAKSWVYNTGEMIDKYPASHKQIRILVNHTAADKNNTWKSREEDCGGKQAKIRLLKAEWKGYRGQIGWW